MEEEHVEVGEMVVVFLEVGETEEATKVEEKEEDMVELEEVSVVVEEKVAEDLVEVEMEAVMEIQ